MLHRSEHPRKRQEIGQMNANVLPLPTTAARPRNAAAPVLEQVLARLDKWSTALSMGRVEAYLAQARDGAELEARSRHVQDALRSPLLLR
jgi:hypothetical protein